MKEGKKPNVIKPSMFASFKQNNNIYGPHFVEKTYANTPRVLQNTKLHGGHLT